MNVAENCRQNLIVLLQKPEQDHDWFTVGDMTVPFWDSCSYLVPSRKRLCQSNTDSSDDGLTDKEGGTPPIQRTPPR